MGTVFLFALVFYRPALSHVIEARLNENVEEDHQGGPDTASNALTRQLRRIRQGETITQLMVELAGTTVDSPAADFEEN
jgi:hypothetical protein